MKKQMINITLPDGSIKKYPKGTTAIEVAEGISSGLARNVLAAEINGEVWDLNRSLNEDVNLKLLTFEDKGGKSTLWHSSAHILAEALEYFYPGINLAIGPPIENGFYYDVDFQDYNISGLVSKCLSKQFSVIFNFPPTNHSTLGVSNSQLRTFVHLDIH